MSVVHCKRDEYDVYIGRGRCPLTGEQGRWGNHFTHLPDIAARQGMVLCESRDAAVAAYRAWLWKNMQADRGLIDRVAKLDGKVLGCWCAPQACHGDVLVAAAAWARADLDRRLAELREQSDHLERAAKLREPGNRAAQREYDLQDAAIARAEGRLEDAAIYAARAAR